MPLCKQPLKILYQIYGEKIGSFLSVHSILEVLEEFSTEEKFLKSVILKCVWNYMLRSITAHLISCVFRLR